MKKGRSGDHLPHRSRIFVLLAAARGGGLLHRGEQGISRWRFLLVQGAGDRVGPLSLLEVVKFGTYMIHWRAAMMISWQVSYGMFEMGRLCIVNNNNIVFFDVALVEQTGG
jgi:hypothetical protein